MSLAITHSDQTTHGRYEIELPGIGPTAELTWRERDKARVIDHTFVPPEMRGQGIAQRLVEAIVADARAQGFRIVPQCSYAAMLFRRHPDWADLVAD